MSSLLLVFALGCPKDSPVEPAAQPDASAPPAPVEAATTAPALDFPLSPEHQALVDSLEQDKVQLTVVDPGAEPRQELRITPAAGHTEKIQMRMDMSMAISLGGMTITEVQVPTMISDLAIEVLEVTPDDQLVVRIETTGAGVDPDAPAQDPTMVAGLTSALEPLIGVAFENTVDRQGRTVTTNLSGAGSLDAGAREQLDSMSRSLGQASPPLPDEPVGAGARWDAASVLDNQGMRILQIGHYELESIEDHVATLNVSFEQHLLGMDTVDTLPPGATLEDVAMNSTGEGKTVHDLRRLAPRQVDLNQDLSIDMTMSVDGQQITTTTSLGIGVVLSQVE